MNKLICLRPVSLTIINFNPTVFLAATRVIAVDFPFPFIPPISRFAAREKYENAILFQSSVHKHAAFWKFYAGGNFNKRVI